MARAGAVTEREQKPEQTARRGSPRDRRVWIAHRRSAGFAAAGVRRSIPEPAAMPSPAGRAADRLLARPPALLSAAAPDGRRRPTAGLTATGEHGENDKNRAHGPPNRYRWAARSVERPLQNSLTSFVTEISPRAGTGVFLAPFKMNFPTVHYHTNLRLMKP